jgi:hypothetical protein
MLKDEASPFRGSRSIGNLSRHKGEDSCLNGRPLIIEILKHEVVK